MGQATAPWAGRLPGRIGVRKQPGSLETPHDQVLHSKGVYDALRQSNCARSLGRVGPHCRVIMALPPAPSKQVPGAAMKVQVGFC